VDETVAKSDEAVSPDTKPPHYWVVLGIALVLAGVVVWQGWKIESLASTLARIDEAGKAQIRDSREAGQKLKVQAEAEKEANRKAVEGSQGGGCAISGDAFNRLRERQAR